jgi:hypothetical protein
MKSIVCTYPDFRDLPKGLKQLLVNSETHFFEEIHAAPARVENNSPGPVRLWQEPQKQFSANGYAAFSA